MRPVVAARVKVSRCAVLNDKLGALGQIDPSKEPYKSKLQAAGITVIDLTNVKSDDRLNHSKIAESPAIVALSWKSNWRPDKPYYPGSHWILPVPPQFIGRAGRL